MGEERLPCSSYLLGALKSMPVIYPMKTGTQEPGTSLQKSNLWLSTEGFLNKQT